MALSFGLWHWWWYWTGWVEPTIDARHGTVSLQKSRIPLSITHKKKKEYILIYRMDHRGWQKKKKKSKQKEVSADLRDSHIYTLYRHNGPSLRVQCLLDGRVF